VALVLGDWRLSDQGAGYIIQGERLDSDLYWLTHPPFRLRLRMGDRVWRWPLADYDGEVITVAGPPEE